MNNFIKKYFPQEKKKKISKYFAINHPVYKKTLYNHAF